MAEVQRIIAGNLAPTPVPVATATPAPTCSGAIWWFEARTYVGESRTVQGPVVAARLAPNAESVLEVGQRYPDPTGFVVSVPPGADARLTGRTICVTGRIRTAAGTTTMDVRDAAAIVVVN